MSVFLLPDPRTGKEEADEEKDHTSSYCGHIHRLQDFKLRHCRRGKEGGKEGRKMEEERE